MVERNERSALRRVVRPLPVLPRNPRYAYQAEELSFRAARGIWPGRNADVGVRMGGIELRRRTQSSIRIAPHRRKLRGIYRMSHNCPCCHATFRRIRISRARRPGIPWYRYSPHYSFCPKCGTELRCEFRPIGHVLNALMYFFAAGWTIWFLLNPVALVRSGPLTVLWLPLALMPVCVCMSLFGVRYKAATPDLPRQPGKAQ